MKTSSKGLALIKHFEGFRAKAYRDVVGVWTIGYGFTKNVKEGDVITKEEAEARLIAELAEYEIAVEQACTVVPNQNQFDALDVDTSWAAGDTITIVNNGFIIGMGGARRASSQSPRWGARGTPTNVVRSCSPRQLL